MGLAEGRNAGVTGLLDLAAQAAKFVGQALGWEKVLAVGAYDDAGRADGIWGNKLALAAGGMITISGLTELAGQPTPNTYEGERGTLTLTQHTGVTAVYSVMVRQSTFTKPTKETGRWGFTHVCDIVAAPVLSGWGQTNGAAVQTFADKELWRGINKTVDPNGLASLAGQKWRVFGLGDTDAAEATKINALLGAVSAPFSGMKLRTGAFARLSSKIAEIDVVWGLTDTLDDVEMPATVTQDDPTFLAEQGTVCLVTGSGTPPSVPAAPVGQHVGTDSVQLNDGNWKHTFNYAVSTSRQRVEFEGTAAETDPSSLQDEERITAVNNSSTPPSTPTASVSGVKFRRRISKRIAGTPEQWEHTFLYARRTTQDDVEMEGSTARADPNELEPGGTVTLVTNSATPPATPSAPTAGGIFSTSSSKQLHDLRWAHTFNFAPRDTVQDVEMAHTVGRGLPHDAGRYETSTVISSASSAAALAAAYLAAHVSDLEFDGVEVRKLTGNRAEVILKTRDNVTVVRFQMETSGRLLVPAQVDDDGDVTFYLARKHQVGTGLWHMLIGEQWHYGSRMRFWISERVDGTPPLPMHFDLAGTSNDATFLGLDANTVAYAGIGGQAEITNNSPAELAWEFLYDSAGIIDYRKGRGGWQWTTTDLSALVEGTWCKATDLGFDSVVLAGADYDAAFL